MNIISQIPLVSGIAIVTATVANVLYCDYKQHKANSAFNDLRQQMIKRISEYNKKLKDLNTENRHVVIYNTRINNSKYKFELITDITPEMMKAASRNRQLSQKIKKEFALDEVEIVRVEHVKNFCDFTFTEEKNSVEDDIDNFTQRRELVAA